MNNKRSLAARVYDFLSGYGLAVMCLLLLLLLTWLSTLEQSVKGLYEVQKRYYDAEAWFVIPDLTHYPWMPEVNGKPLFIPLPGAYLVSAVLFVNLLLGGIVRIRKGLRNIGVIIAHFSMVSLLVAGFVSHHYSKEGIMFILQGDTSDYAQSYTEYTIEVSEIVNGERTEPFVVGAEYLKPLDWDETLDVEFSELPFDIRVSHWMRNSAVFQPRDEDTYDLPVVDGMALSTKENETSEEQNMAGCYVDVIPESGAGRSVKLLLFGGNPDMVTATIGGKVYGFTLVREIWPMPFRVRLDKSVGEYYPGTMKPSSFQSDITRLADGSEKAFSIRMNEPMRYGGYTLYQARWSGETERPQSGFAIVRNPSDKWPEYSLYIAMLGLTIHFGMRLGGFVIKSSKPSSKKGAIA